MSPTRKARFAYNRDRLAQWAGIFLIGAVVWLSAISVANKIQAQRRTTLYAVCKRQDAKHHTLYGQIRHERETNRRTLTGLALKVAEVQQDNRSELVGVLEPWEDCKQRVAKAVH